MLPTWTRTELLGLPLDLVRREDLLVAVPHLIRSGRPHHLVALNPIKVMRADHEPELRDLIRNATCVFPDATGIAWAVRMLEGRRLPVLPGCELMEDLLELADRRHYRVFLVGARPEVIRQMRRRLAERLPGLEVAGAFDGYFAAAEQPRLARKAVQAKPDMLFVGMGARRQEAFLRAVDAAGGVPVMMAVGGSFDAYVGAVARPPRWLRRLHLEWLYRLVRQPFRAPRMVALPRFACRVLQARFLRRAGADRPIG